MEQKTVSFGFSKIKKNKSLGISKISEGEVEKNEEAEFVTEVDENFAKSTKPKAKEFVIPLIKENKWRVNASGNQIEDSAVQELVEDARKFQEAEQGKGQTDMGLNIPLLMQNKIPEGFETDDKLDVGLRPDEPEENDYEEIPIDQFGLAMLRGMGWQEGQGIGKNNKAVAPVNAVLRPKGLGLGADRSQAAQLNDSKKGSGKNDNEEALVLKKGAYCVLLKGANKDMYGIIEGLDEDNARVMVKLTLGGNMVTQSQYAIRLVDSHDYKKYSKYLNKVKADKYKEEEERKKEKDRKRERHHKSKRDKHRDEDSDHDSKHYEEDNRQPSSDSRKRKHDRLDDYADKPKISQNGNSRSEPLWIKPQIRVRIISKDYKKGRYYNTKVNVIDVLSLDNCVCQTDDGKVLEEISQSELETVIPKQENAHVLIVSGKQKGQLARIMKKDKSRYIATLQLLRDRDEVINIDFDKICEYSGNIDEEYDY
ncbi:G-patch domain and KOW motifs-containing protein-like [Mytilus galloprovincialis]|uniref:G-patch domain and KOW motifs-containing protein-like n=1 Tax=Mytilus galloprovincialis TaxID=29158 RepID=UPI003F7BFAE8